MSATWNARPAAPALLTLGHTACATCKALSNQPSPPLPYAGNPLQHLPPGGLRCCPELRTLDLSAIPAAAAAAMPAALLAPAPKLEAVSLANCRMGAAPWEALRRAAGSLRRLDLSGNSLAELPALVCEFKR